MNHENINNLTDKIIEAAFMVSNKLGCGFLEKVYENSLIIELAKRNIKVEQQKPINVYYDNTIVGEYFADLLVDDVVVVELKTVNSIENIHKAQLINYLKATNKKAGLILNFAKPRVEIKRMVNDL